jgi:hypothetical protein
MLALDSAAGSRYSGVAWFATAAAASAGGNVLGRLAYPRNPELEATNGLLLAAAFIGLVVAGLSTWRLVRCRADSWLLPLAALNLAFLQAGRAGDAASWRLEWGVFGIVLTVAVVLLFGRLIRRTDELQRRTSVEGAAAGLVLALPLAMAYALFEPLLPVMRAQWVTMALLLLWWGGWLAAEYRYR